MTTTPPITPPPSPSAAIDEASFVAELRRLRTWSGLSFRQLERRASTAGDVLPSSTAATMLGKNRLPREDLLVTYVRACGLDGDDLKQWVITRALIAAGTPATPAAVSAPVHHPTPPPRPASRWRPAIAAAALALAFAAGAVLTANAGADSIVNEETVVLSP
ncbi:helix-turn-helix domain-containing protein [Allonocardiopsis opalescens]|uniref:Helix-turn-helix protein n=1 Tax=Allonocardiopsis opalescens TaxID=1144618 RepID=A0A2T0QCR9_9ACTN|nr:helix-turn-helix transcriptional regulator [Allonocardiopsis opalescens]PRY01702.1 hypothetical protein CLV72_101286 [Allonocardiopsis opalescens]